VDVRTKMFFVGTNNGVYNFSSKCPNIQVPISRFYCYLMFYRSLAQDGHSHRTGLIVTV